jgi:hypothetical protein
LRKHQRIHTGEKPVWCSLVQSRLPSQVICTSILEHTLERNHSVYQIFCAKLLLLAICTYSKACLFSCMFSYSNGKLFKFSEYGQRCHWDWQQVITYLLLDQSDKNHTEEETKH